MVTTSLPKFSKKGRSTTLAAREVFKILTAARHFLSAYEIAKIIEQRFNVSTIYRILEKFQEEKLVHEFQGKWKLCTNPENHEESHHFLICEKCGMAEEIFLDYQESISRQLAREKNFVLRKVHLGFLGVCRECHT